MKMIAALLISWLLGTTQNLPEVLKQGEDVFNKNCATGYCHGPKGAAGGAPRLAARAFDQAYITTVTTRGIPNTAMSGFATKLSRTEFPAVIAYVASLNGISNPSLTPAPPPVAPPDRPLTPEAARGRDLFFEAVRGFGRCSTCHEVNGLGMPVATPIAKVPASAQELRSLATPQVSTATIGSDTMPALVLSKGARGVIFYDLTTVPPVLRTEEPTAVKLVDGSKWQHSSVITSYKDAGLEAILMFLRAVIP